MALECNGSDGFLCVLLRTESRVVCEMSVLWAREKCTIQTAALFVYSLECGLSFTSE